jgi:hypothetical protein
MTLGHAASSAFIRSTVPTLVCSSRAIRRMPVFSAGAALVAGNLSAVAIPEAAALSAGVWLMRYALRQSRRGQLRALCGDKKNPKRADAWGAKIDVASAWASDDRAVGPLGDRVPLPVGLFDNI